MPGGANAGNGWKDLYACYFGPTGTSSCAGMGVMCHATADSYGAYQWVCGGSAATCRQGAIAGMLTSGTDPTMALLYSQVCQVDSSGMMSGLMPLNCPTTSILVPSDMARIKAWLAAGAPDN
jgi:hypothetical protein